MPDKVCVVAGVGPGTGLACVKRFAAGGYRVAKLARSDARLKEWRDEVAGSLGVACDVTDRGSVEAAFSRIRDELGPVDVLVYNAAKGVFAEFMDLDPAAIEENFQINTMGLVHCGQVACADMLERGAGAVVVTGNTSARRGKAHYAGFAPTKAAQRILAEAMARGLGPKGIHVSYLVIDAVISVPWTRERFKDAPEDFFAQPDDLAETVWGLAHQPKSAWTFEADIRPFGETW